MFSFSTMYAIFAVMVVVLPVPAPARISWGALGVDSVCDALKRRSHYGTGFEQAINAWLIASLVMTCYPSRLLIQ